MKRLKRSMRSCVEKQGATQNTIGVTWMASRKIWRGWSLCSNACTEIFCNGSSGLLLTPSESTNGIHKTNYEWGTHISLEQPPISRYSQTWKWPQRDDYIENIVRGIDPDIIHLHHLDCLGLCVWEQRLRDIPILYTLHDYASICSRGQLYDPRRNMICNGPRVYECATCLII